MKWSHTASDTLLTITGLLVLVSYVCLFGGTSVASDGASHAVTPEAVEPPQKYVFYMHGAWIERHGLDQPHPVHGHYRYNEIVAELTRQGFQVVSEVRQGRVHPLEYAREVVDQVRDLLEDRVPSDHITVRGHSKGGLMTLIVASLVQHPEVNYVVLAGCGKSGSEFRRSYTPFLQQHAPDLRGRILSIYDSADREAGTCQEAFRQIQGLQAQEAVLHAGRGHELFYSPSPVWVDMVTDWLD